MRKLLGVFFALGFMSMVVAAKGPETIKIRLGQSGLADKGKVAIKFLSIVDDSRCPVGTTCVWAGNAKVKLLISRGKARRTVEVNTGIDPKVASAFGYSFRIADLSPKPGEPHRMIAQPNVLTITIEKTS